jgi:hypothetical protein
MKRREIFPILGAAAMAAFSAEVSSPRPADYKPRVLSGAEYDLVTKLADMILPADELSAGAGEAGAAFYIDTLLVYTTPSKQNEFKTNLKPLLNLDGPVLDAALAKMAEDERNPRSFFVLLKLMIMDAYCMSPEGRRYLRYSGDTAMAQFKGCDHPEHKRI